MNFWHHSPITMIPGLKKLAFDSNLGSNYHVEYFIEVILQESAWYNIFLLC